jgi:hypothetical protein
MLNEVKHLLCDFPNSFDQDRKVKSRFFVATLLRMTHEIKGFVGVRSAHQFVARMLRSGIRGFGPENEGSKSQKPEFFVSFVLFVVNENSGRVPDSSRRSLYALV